MCMQFVLYFWLVTVSGGDISQWAIDGPYKTAQECLQAGRDLQAELVTPSQCYTAVTRRRLDAREL